MQSKAIGIGIVGLGFMGATHVKAYQLAARHGFPCRLVAVADPCESRRRGDFGSADGNIAAGSNDARAFDAREVRDYSDAGDLFADLDVQLVSICTPTDTHVALASAALRAGKHVLVEKPVALRADDIRSLQRIANDAKRICMPAMCMRFWPAWKWLKDRIDDRTFGAVRAAMFQRTGAAPKWSQEFYSDHHRSGGALVDLHIHDADFVRYCFGEPTGVRSVGSINHVTTTYHFNRSGAPAQVKAEGGWLAPDSPFHMRYVVEFERATADFDLSRDPELVMRRDDRSERVVNEDAGLSAYDHEVRYVVRCAAEGVIDTSPNLDDAIAVTELLDAERASLAEV